MANCLNKNNHQEVNYDCNIWFSFVVIILWSVSVYLKYKQHSRHLEVGCFHFAKFQRQHKLNAPMHEWCGVRLTFFFIVFFSFCLFVWCRLWSDETHTHTSTQKNIERTIINLILRHFIEDFEWIKYHNQEFIGGHFDGRRFLATINLCSLIPVSAEFCWVNFDKELQWWRQQQQQRLQIMNKGD